MRTFFAPFGGSCRRAALYACALSVLCAAPLSAETIHASTCAQGDVQAAIDRAAPTGDTVLVPAGHCTWTQPVVFIDKDVAILMAGMGQTVLTSHQPFLFFVHITNQARGAFRLSGFTVKGDVAEVLKVSSNSAPIVPAGMWRLDHVHFDFRESGVDHGGVHQVGVNYGLIDHCVADWPLGGIFLRHALGLNAEDGSSNSDKSTWPGNFSSQIPTNLGGSNFTFVEDCTFNATRANFTDVYDASAGGGRVVFRHNTLNGWRLYNHWTRGKEVAAQVMEIYNNTWLRSQAFDPGHVVRVEGGTGVFFNNTSDYNNGKPFIILDDRRSGGFGGPVGGEATTGTTWERCDGTKPWDGNAGDPSAPGWPCLFQIGRAPGVSFVALANGSAKQASEPFYLWNNGTEPGCATGGFCTNTIAAYVEPASYIRKTPHPNGEVDYVEGTPKPDYRPFPYPHPLSIGGAIPVPDTPVPVDPCVAQPIELSVTAWPTKNRKTRADFAVSSPRGQATVTFTFQGQTATSATASDGACTVTVRR